MSEIKSTLDLIMEKTRHLTMNQEEMKSVKKQELVKKIRGITSRFLSGERDAAYLDHQIRLLPEEEQSQARETCKNQFMEDLHPLEDNQRILAGVETLFGKEERDRWERTIDNLRAPLTAESERVHLEAESHFREILAAEGLQGPAVLPRVEKSPLVQEEKERLLKTFKEAIKGGVLTSD